MTAIFRLPLHEDKNEISSCEMTKIQTKIKRSLRDKLK
jgi:hypothetical protein